MIPRRADGEPVPLSFAQARMWFLQQLDPSSPAYNVCLAISLRGELDVGALQTAFCGLVERHELLRTRYLTDADDVPVQVVDPEARVALPVVELEPGAAPEREARVRELTRQAAATPFDLDTDHPLRVSLVRRGPDDHVLVLTVHHIAWDGGTFNALSTDLSALYRQALTGEPAGLEPLPVQYGDVAAWQRRTWTDEHLADALRYWHRQLTPLPEPLPLPTDAPRRAVPSEAGDRWVHDFDPTVTERITAFCRQARVTPYMALLAGLSALLHRYTGSVDVPVGSATMNRDVAGLERLVGNFGNTLVMRTDVSGDPTFAELVERVRTVCTDGYAHQDAPFDKLVETLRPERHGGRSVLFDVMLLFLTRGLHGPDLPGVSVDWETVHTGMTQFDLALEAFLIDGRLRVEATYRSELFTEATIERLLGHLETLLATGVADPRRRLSGLDVLSPAERDLVLRQWNDTAEPMPATTLLDLLREQAARTPERTAVEYGDARLSYAELDAMANQLARRLARHGVGPERCVGVHCDRSIEMVVGLLAVLKAGGAFVPVEPSWPAQRIAEVCRNARLTAALAHPGRGGALADAGVPVVEVDLADPGLHAVDDGDPGVRVDPEGLAYVIYTSGSTGVPKGAMIRHRAIAHRLVWQRDFLGFGTGDAALFKAPLGFDISINEVFLPLVAGGRLVIAEPGGERDTEYLLETVRRHEVTFVYVVSSMLDLMLGLEDFPGRARSLRHVWCGGEVLTPELFDRFRAASPAVLYHGYGPAEATIGVSHVAYRDAEQERSLVSIGSPNSNTRLYVLDPNLAPVPIGVAGELYAGGVYLGRGYVNDPRRTAERFVADPFGPPGSRLYRTGDLARWRPDGTLEFLGRADNQVKIRGMRVELEEIEAVLEQHPDIRRAAAVVREDAPGVKRLAGYGVALDPTADAEELSERVRGWLAERVPEHMVPQALVLLPEFPLMPSGKVDRARLPEPGFGSAADRSRAPATAREELLCGLFADALGLPSVGADDDFFRLGGDSIVSVQLVHRARRAGIRATPRQVFEHPTPAGLAAVAGAVTGREADDLARGEVELTPMMRGTRAPDGSFGGLNQTVLLVTPPAATRDALGATVQAVLDRHDMLRARWDGARLVVPAPGSVGAEDALTRVPGSPRDADLAGVAAAARARLRPREGRMVELVWFDAGDRPGRLMVVAHHLVVDWVSWSILSTDLEQAWADVDAGRPPSLARTGTSFRRWTELLADDARSAERLEELPRWTGILERGDTRLFDRELDPARDVVKTLQRAELLLPPERAEPLLTQLPQAYFAGVPEVLLTGLAVGLAGDRGRGIVVGLEGHGREEQIAAGTDLSTTVGWFTTFFPVHLDLDGIDAAEARRGRPEAGAALKRVKEQVRAAPDRGLGYGLLRHLNPDGARSLAALPEPQLTFNYLGRFARPSGEPWGLAPETATFRVPPEDDHPVAVAVDVNAMAVEHDDGTWLHITLAWPDGLAARDAVDAVMARWDEALAGLGRHASDPDAGGHTPSDLAQVALTQDDIDELEDDLL